jgi:ribosomal protein L16 Arg81 hydroxylase
VYRQYLPSTLHRIVLPGVMARIRLNDLIAPLDVERFFRDHWSAGPCAADGPMARFAELYAIAELQEAEALCRRWGGRLLAWPPPRSPAQPTRIDAADAMRYYAEGCTLYFQYVEKFVPALVPILRRLEGDFGLATGEIVTEVFFSDSACGAKPHYDFDFNFSVQLHGIKRWRVTRGAIVERPPEGASLGSLPDDAHSFTANPGTVIFVPPGFGHATAADERSAAITFAVRPRTWHHRLRTTFEKALQAEPTWRDRPVAAHGELPLREHAERLLADATARMRSLVAFVQAVPARPMALRVARPLTTHPRDASSGDIMLSGFDDEASEIAIDAPSIPIVQWLLQLEGTFYLPELLATFPDRHADDLRRLIDNLVVLGALERGDQLR